jgi:kynureninase
MTRPTTRLDCEALDRADPLAAMRDAFHLPGGVVYLDGNSLGPLPKATAARVREVVEEEWGVGLIRSWNDAGWFDKPRTLGDRLASMIGAGPGEVVVCDSTSVNLFKVVVAAAQLRPGRSVVVSDRDNFPTDLYMIEGATGLLEGYDRRLTSPDGPSLADVLDEDVAMVVLTHVDYRTGHMHDLTAVTEQVQRAGALMVWDLAHSAGAVPVDLNGAGADFAVGCTYKYLNGGPGSPAFVFAATRHQDQVSQPLSGWHGHARPFAFVPAYEAAEGISRFLCGTPPLLSYAGLEASLEMWAGVDLATVREKSLALTSLFMDLVGQQCAEWGLEVVTPREPDLRGSQVSLRHQEGYAVVQALIERGVIGDFRAPDLMRFGFTPLYLGFAEVWDAVTALRDVLEHEEWRAERFHRRASVT